MGPEENYQNGGEPPPDKYEQPPPPEGDSAKLYVGNVNYRVRDSGML